LYTTKLAEALPNMRSLILADRLSSIDASAADSAGSSTWRSVLSVLNRDGPKQILSG
jgi:hypothetical protein